MNPQQSYSALPNLALSQRLLGPLDYQQLANQAFHSSRHLPQALSLALKNYAQGNPRVGQIRHI